MNQGRIEQAGTPGEVYDNPANAFVYRFLGDVNLFHGRSDGPSEYARPSELEITKAAVVADDSVFAKVECHSFTFRMQRSRIYSAFCLRWPRRKVLDKTGLSGHYDFTLCYAPDRSTAGGDRSDSLSPN